MTKYIITLIVLSAASGLFLYSQTQTVQSPDGTSPVRENPFGEGATTVGPLEGSAENVVTVPKNDTPVSAGSGTQTDATQTSGEQTGSAKSGGMSEGGLTGSTGTGVSTGTVTSEITRAELSKHNTQADCWVAYKSVVYDITSWLPRHPGSAAAIAPYCGKAEEFATAFNGQHGTSKDSRLEREGTNEGPFSN